MIQQSTRRPVPDWLEPLTEMRRQGWRPASRGVTFALGMPEVIRSAINIPDTYKPEPGDDYRAVAGLDVELLFSRTTGYHRLRLICEGCLAADARRLLLLPDTEDPLTGWNPTTFILLKRGGL